MPRPKKASTIRKPKSSKKDSILKYGKAGATRSTYFKWLKNQQENL